MARQPVKKAYLYCGPVTPVPMPGKEPLMLFPGKSYRDLPDDDPTISNLIERRLLVAETDNPSATPAILTPDGDGERA